MFYGIFFNADVAYYALYRAVQENGTTFYPRDKICKEVRPASFGFENPQESLYRGKKRKLNYRFWAAEALGYIAGADPVQQAKLLLPINPALEFVLNKTTQGFDGAYGPFISTKLPEICRQLRHDKYTRQAVIPIWNMNTELNSLDVPCTISMQFFLDQDYFDFHALSMHVSMRSNDLNWGFPYDVAAFSAIQLAVAADLGWHIGKYYHTAGSLHYYMANSAQVEKEPMVVPFSEEDRWRSNILRVPCPHACFIEDVIHGAQQLVTTIIDHYDRGFGKAPITSAYVECLDNDNLRVYFEHWLGILNGEYKDGA